MNTYRITITPRTGNPITARCVCASMGEAQCVAIVLAGDDGAHVRVRRV